MSARLPADYAERVYAGWLGKCIGVRLGATGRGLDLPGDLATRWAKSPASCPCPRARSSSPTTTPPSRWCCSAPWRTSAPNPVPRRFGETVLNYLADQRGTFWWGGYGVSSEHTAYANLAAGIPAPQSGSAALNGRTIAEQIGGQIFSDIWGLVAPGQPDAAAEMAARAASVTHDGEALLGARFVAGAVSLAFGEPDPRRIVAGALALVDAQSEYARRPRAVCDFHAQHPADWRACMSYLYEQFGYDRYPGVVHIIPNAGVVVMALLYGEGDFSHSVQIATMAGWDTDCNAGNVGAIMGVAAGLDGIDAHWRAPMNDLLIAASLSGTRNLTDIATVSGRIADFGARRLGGQAGAGLDVPSARPLSL